MMRRTRSKGLNSKRLEPRIKATTCQSLLADKVSVLEAVPIKAMLIAIAALWSLERCRWQTTSWAWRPWARSHESLSTHLSQQSLLWAAKQENQAAKASLQGRVCSDYLTNKCIWLKTCPGSKSLRLTILTFNIPAVTIRTVNSWSVKRMMTSIG